MPRYAVFLRGINVTGSRITNEKLRAPFAALGFGGVSTFRASGNVVFDAPSVSGRQIEQRLAADLGLTKAVAFVRSAPEMRALAAATPFEGRVHVILLLKKPDPAVLDHATGDDMLALGAKEVFWRPKGRMIDSELDLKAVERLVGPTTMRTKGTIDQIAERWFRGAPSAR